MAPIDPPDHLSDAAARVWREVIADAGNPDAIVPDELAAYCDCVALERDASARVAREGTIVADERGRPIAHPAIAVARQAQQDIKGWGDRFRRGGKSPARAAPTSSAPPPQRSGGSVGDRLAALKRSTAPPDLAVVHDMEGVRDNDGKGRR